MQRLVSLTLCLVLAAFFALPSGLGAQVLYGSIIVDVRDQTGGAVPGAEATITQHRNGLDAQHDLQ